MLTGGVMRSKFVFVLTVGILAFALTAFAQVATRAGGIYGNVKDDKGAPLPGVTVTLESVAIPSQTATTGDSGQFRFADLPPSTYSVSVSLTGFSEVRQEDVKVGTGSQVQLDFNLK